MEQQFLAYNAQQVTRVLFHALVSIELLISIYKKLFSFSSCNTKLSETNYWGVECRVEWGLGEGEGSGGGWFGAKYGSLTNPQNLKYLC